MIAGWRRAGVATAVLGALLVAGCRASPASWYRAAQRARAISGRSRVRLHPCVEAQVASALALCGEYAVFEHRDARRGRRISLHLVILPASGPKPQPDPVVPIDGGPGLGSASSAGIADLVEGSWSAHDIVLVDQRGTGRSAPLRCDLYGGGRHAQPYLGARLPAAGVRACRDRLGGEADLTQYTTPIASDDLDEVLTALGYGQVDLVGFSYGGRVAMVFIKRHADRVRSAVIAWGIGPDFPIPLPMAAGARAALDDVLADCRRDSRCQATYPDPGGELDSVLVRLDRSPAQVTLPPNKWRKTSDTVTLTRLGFAESILELLYSIDHAHAVPYWAHEVYQGHLVPFLQEAERAHRVRWDANATGMLLSVLCAEDVPYVDSAAAAQAMAVRPIGLPMWSDLHAGCTNWVRAALPAGERDPVITDRPILFIAGARDPTGERGWADAERRRLTNSVEVVMPLYGHGDSDDCTVALTDAFIARPVPSALDTTCVTHVHSWPFRYKKIENENRESRIEKRAATQPKRAPARIGCGRTNASSDG